MKRLLLAVVCCLAVFGAACTKSGTRPAATVNGQRIATQALVDELDAIAGNKDYLDGLKTAAANQGTKVEGSTPGSFDIAFATSTLRGQILYALVHQEVAKQGIKPDDACATAARKEVYAQVGFSDETKGEATFAKFPKTYQDSLLQRNTELLALQAHLAGQDCVADDPAKTYYDANPDDFLQTCGSVIVVADKTTADATVSRLKAGEDFATVASTVSIDSQTAGKGGDFGCKTKSELSSDAIPPFFTTPVGQVSDPADLGGQAFLIVKVTSRKQAALEDVRQQAEELAASAASSAFQSFVRQAAQSATVTVDARYGVWNPQTINIDMPASATASSSDSGGSGVVPSSSS